ncbi:hypothetical protein [Burkholderia thailandensis]|uniref:hypothetical protein n=1 Tax=Burkholderia thailandensis TaxID=57975 RepID=UPI0005B71030|nr:hypothetical protein [Burkholderia thailandensis]AVR10265.1 hypothetical protein A8H31_23600 [Burkholderia thailandensis]KIS56375.1 hypothetical protein BTP_2351 [Burkholderia thailandensis Phuket 4W-1]
MKIKAIAKDYAVGSIVAIMILAAFVASCALILVLAVMLVPYNFSRAATWLFEKIVEGLGWAISWIEDSML